jgi:hypothetical protein
MPRARGSQPEHHRRPGARAGSRATPCRTHRPPARAVQYSARVCVFPPALRAGRGGGGGAGAGEQMSACGSNSSSRSIRFSGRNVSSIRARSLSLLSGFPGSASEWSLARPTRRRGSPAGGPGLPVRPGPRGGRAASLAGTTGDRRLRHTRFLGQSWDSYSVIPGRDYINMMIRGPCSSRRNSTIRVSGAL